MSTALAETKPNGLAVANESASIMSVIARAASDPNVDIAKMTQLLELQERVMAKQAEIQFNEAMTRMRPDLPIITKQGLIVIEKDGVVKQKTPFARYEDIQAAIKPLMVREGFTTSFNSHVIEKGTEYSCKLSHVGGHSDVKTLTLPADTSGSKNSIQAIGSTVQYARRYLMIMTLDLEIRGVDDDATHVDKIGEREVQQIFDLFSACDMHTPESRKKFFQVAEASRVEDIRADKYQGLVALLVKKEKAMREGR